MKTIFFTSVILIAFVAAFTNVSANVWRVNGSTNSTAHYSTLQAAHDAATTINGDTIYLEGSLFATGGLTCTKQLTIIGSGYFLNQNPETQFNQSPSTVDSYIYFYAGSQGSKIMGCTISYSIYIYTSNITIERNLFLGQYSIRQFEYNTNNLKIIGNYFNIYYGYYCLYFPYDATDLIVSNNYFGGIIYMASPSTSGIFMNNIFGSSITIYNSNVINNISISPYYDASLTNCITTNNIGNGTQFPSGTNLQNIASTALFVGATGNSTDGQWHLKPGSPAIGYGESGVDCGLFGGAYPYVLSGMPPIPAIYDFDSPSLPNGNMNVSIKAKSHN